MSRSVVVRRSRPLSSSPGGGAPPEYPAPLAARELLLLVVALLLLLAVETAVAPPTGEFPINDDWAYARIAKHWAETGTFAYTGWNQMMLVTQAALGALVIKLFGFSFTSLRWLGIGLGLLSLVALYGCGRELGLTPRIAAMATF